MAGPGGVGDSATSASSKPLNVEQIVQQAQNYDYNPQIPLRYWLRSANTLLKEVCRHPRCALDTTDVVRAGRDL